jgi:hypothetical protein
MNARNRARFGGAWRDANEDGVSQAGELLSVADDLFIREIPVAPSVFNGDTNVAEAAIGQVHVQNMTLDVNETNTTAALPAEGINFEVFTLPELRGYGAVKNLRQACCA